VGSITTDVLHAAQSFSSRDLAEHALANELAFAIGALSPYIADNIGHARQMAVTPDGTLYVNTWSGAYFNNGPVPAGGFVVALKDTHGNGHADVIERFGETVASGGHGGTGLVFHNGMIYAETNDRIVRYPVAPNEIAPQVKGETVVSDLPIIGDHPMHPFLITPKGDLFVDLGSATNDCEKRNRFPHSPGNDPCTEKATRAGVWRYDANKTDQRFSPAERYASGLRNGEGFSLDAAGRIFVTQHGRDQLREDWPELYSAKQGQDLPAEEVVELRQGADYGWPECYFDNAQRKLVLAPEYGGDGGKKIGICAERQGPVAFFPAHSAPNDMKVYLGKTFPKAYQGGAFIAFHGSWNRAPGPQSGYNIVFQPLADGRVNGAYVVFADGFAGWGRYWANTKYDKTFAQSLVDDNTYLADKYHDDNFTTGVGAGFVLAGKDKDEPSFTFRAMYYINGSYKAVLRNSIGVSGNYLTYQVKDVNANMLMIQCGISFGD